MGGLKEEAGVSPALSRNCNPQECGKPGRSPYLLLPRTSPEGGGDRLSR